MYRAAHVHVDARHVRRQQQGGAQRGARVGGAELGDHAVPFARRGTEHQAAGLVHHVGGTKRGVQHHGGGEKAAEAHQPACARSRFLNSPLVNHLLRVDDVSSVFGGQ